MAMINIAKSMLSLEDCLKSKMAFYMYANVVHMEAVQTISSLRLGIGRLKLSLLSLDANHISLTRQKKA